MPQFEKPDSVQAANDVVHSSSRKSSDRYVSGIYDTPEAANRAYQGLTTDHG